MVGNISKWGCGTILVLIAFVVAVGIAGGAVRRERLERLAGDSGTPGALVKQLSGAEATAGTWVGSDVAARGELLAGQAIVVAVEADWVSGIAVELGLSLLLGGKGGTVEYVLCRSLVRETSGQNH